MNDTLLLAVIAVGVLGSLVTSAKRKPIVPAKQSAAWAWSAATLVIALIVLWIVWGFRTDDWLIVAAVLTPSAAALVFTGFREAIDNQPKAGR